METQCNWQPLGDAQWKCADCGKVRSWAGDDLPPRRNCPSEAAKERAAANVSLYPVEEVPQDGPGTELATIFNSLGVEPRADCGCAWGAAQMNQWGVSGCREHFDEIVGWLRDGSAKFSWSERMKAAASAAASGLAFSISWADPFPDIVRLAIKRAEAKAAKSPESA